ncbi:MAG: hypothetical protein HRF50_05490 [Phycisphaerae bacterium]|jgi:hypothetical protein
MRAAIGFPLLLAGIGLFLPACGRQEEDRPVYNRVLGDTAVGAPPAAPAVDVGILRDQAAYQPAKYAEAQPAAGGGGEADAALQVARNALQSLVELDAATLLESFVPEQVKALAEDLAPIEEAIDAGKKFNAAVRDKTKDRPPEQAEAMKKLDTLPQQLVATISAALKADVLDADNAVVSVDSAKFQEGFSALMAEFGPALAAVSAAAPGAAGAAASPGQPAALPPGMAAPPGALTPEMLAEIAAQSGDAVAGLPGVKLRRVGDAWKIDIQHTINDEEAELVNEAAALARELFDQLYGKIEAAPKLDDQALTNIAMQTVMPMTGRFMLLFQRAQELFGRSDAPGDAAASAPAEPEAPGQVRPGATKPAGKPEPKEPNKP